MYFESMGLPLQIGLGIGTLFLMATLVIILWQVARSHTPFDRVLALDLIGGTGLCIFVLLAIAMDLGVLLDAAFAIAVVSFLGTVAFAKYLVKGTEK